MELEPKLELEDNLMVKPVLNLMVKPVPKEELIVKVDYKVKQDFMVKEVIKPVNIKK